MVILMSVAPVNAFDLLCDACYSAVFSVVYGRVYNVVYEMGIIHWITWRYALIPSVENSSVLWTHGKRWVWSVIPGEGGAAELCSVHLIS
ncbi:hypothetical protein Y032_0091g2440 [Ancylostoma ceylanicum]|uniref:Uncharacterized protein n=1 Tax=Ancylostoma ceylanicum TaxID=53326 RepID=A0A016TMQ4_9BILA|nr:hypothetical protein Y032_0091g2440 [Ancylostoma ceylanicum]